jgi:hypothetical protein
MPPEFQQLNQWRLERDWTWNELALYMGAPRAGFTSVHISPRTLAYLLTRDDAKPLDRTVFKIVRFVKQEQAALAKKPKRRGVAA